MILSFVYPHPQLRCNICTAHFVQIPDFSYGANIAPFVVNQFLHTMLRELSYHHGRHGGFMQEMVMQCGMWLPGVQLFQLFCVFFLVQLLEGITYAQHSYVKRPKMRPKYFYPNNDAKVKLPFEGKYFFFISTRGTQESSSLWCNNCTIRIKMEKASYGAIIAP